MIGLVFRLKPDIRILGIDDGKFQRGISISSILAGVLVRLDRTIENMATTRITVDGADIVDGIKEILDRIRVRPSLIMADGVTFAGFNIIDPVELFTITGISVMTVHRGLPDISSMLSAIRSLQDARKESVLLSLNPSRVVLAGKEYTINTAGIESEEAIAVLRKTVVNGYLPEPIRLAHMLASSF